MRCHCVLPNRNIYQDRPGTSAGKAEKKKRRFLAGKIDGLPPTYKPQCDYPQAPQYFPERSMCYGWLVLKGPGNAADSFAQCKDGHMLK